MFLRRPKKNECTALFAVFLIGISAWVRWLNSPFPLWWLTPEQIQHGLVPVPPGFEESVKALPKRPLTDSEREVFRKDGAVLIKNAIPNATLLNTLQEVLGWQKGQVHNEWWWNGVVHTLIKHGPLAEMSASALDVPEVTIWNTQLEPRPGLKDRPWPLPEKPWYDTHYSDPRDQSVHEDTDGYVGHLHKSGHFVKPQASIFLAITDVPYGLAFLAGSHVHNQRHRCRRDIQTFGIDKACMDRLEKDCYGTRSFNLSAGDLVMFYGSTFHWTIFQEKPRLAFSIRYVPADMMYTGFVKFPGLASHSNWKCQPIGGCPAFPIFYSNDSSRMQEQPWPLYPRNRDMSAPFQILRQLAVWLDPRCGMIYDW